MQCVAIRSFSVFALSLLSIATSLAQGYTYKQYDVKDGMAGATVYHLLQDREGFIWFATGTGLSRFDGTRFKNFSIQDGLPDNEILHLFEDRRGRIWMAPFKNAICYFYKGKIYNQQNDPLLKQLKLVEFVTNICESENGDLLLTDSKTLYLIDTANKVRVLDKAEPFGGAVVKVAPSHSGKFYVSFAYKLFMTDTKTYQFRYNMPVWGGSKHVIINDHMNCWAELNNRLRVLSPRYHLDYSYPVPAINALLPVNDSVICLNTAEGAIFFNIVTRKATHHFLPDKNVSSFMIDKEGGYWFSTLNNGVYRLGSPVFKNISQKTKEGQTLGVYELKMQDSIIWAGSDLGYLQKIKGGSSELVKVTQTGVSQPAHHVAAIAVRGKQLVAGCGIFIYVKQPNNRFLGTQGHSAIKQVKFINDTQLIVAGSNSLYKGSFTKLNTVPLLWNGRTSCLFYRNDSTWFGTFDGLYLLKPNKEIFFFGHRLKILHNRILAIEEGKDGLLWIATSEGLVALKNNTILYHFSTRKGLNSNFVRCIGVDSNCIWAGTDKGLNKIDLSPHPASITTYSSADGLNSDIINALLVNGNKVYAGTPEGISWFDKTEPVAPSICNLKLLGVAINDKTTAFAPEYRLPFSNNSIRFDYVAISMKSGGNIIYNYRLRELDTAWKTTHQNTIELISLPPGAYTLELFAVNKFGVRSQLYATKLFIAKPYWQTGWFIIACVLCTIGITAFIVTQRNRMIRRKEEAKRRAERRLQELEQKALRAQMNPHFIFNCLNSIQGFILDKDISTANRYLSRFASLIRQTLDNSFQSLIPLSGEIEYLTTYLQLEQMRHNNKFRFEIEVDNNIEPAAIFIPGMILQPFVENAIVHGLQFSELPGGIITIRFSLQGKMVVSTVNDNGVGRKAAQARKATNKAAYRGRGMQLTQERIDLMNKNLDDKIRIDIIDYTEGAKKGTEVIIRFPYFTNDDLLSYHDYRHIDRR